MQCTPMNTMGVPLMYRKLHKLQQLDHREGRTLLLYKTYRCDINMHSRYSQGIGDNGDV